MKGGVPLTKHRKDTDYLFLAGRVRALERRLLTAAKLEQLLQAADVAACSQLLSELGYEPIRDEASLQESLKQQRQAVFADIARFMPEPALLDVFRLKYDYHNIKTLLKDAENGQRLLMDAGCIPATDMERQYAESGEWQFLPGEMADAARDAAAVLAETGNAQRSDCILDRAYFAQLRKLAAESRCGYLQDYIRAMIDAANLRSLVRAARLHADPGFLRQVLFDGGSVSPDTIVTHAGSGPASLYRATAFRTAAEAGEEAVKGGSLTAFEKACDNAVLSTAGKARGIPFGVEVVLGYLAAKEAEWTAVRIIMSGRMAGMTADAIRERLRDQYV